LHVYKYGSNYVESQFYEKPISLIKEHQKSHLNEMALSVVMDVPEPLYISLTSFNQIQATVVIIATFRISKDKPN